MLPSGPIVGHNVLVPKDENVLVTVRECTDHRNVCRVRVRQHVRKISVHGSLFLRREFSGVASIVDVNGVGFVLSDDWTKHARRYKLGIKQLQEPSE
jgi:hypothetical protein